MEKFHARADRKKQQNWDLTWLCSPVKAKAIWCLVALLFTCVTTATKHAWVRVSRGRCRGTTVNQISKSNSRRRAFCNSIKQLGKGGSSHPCKNCQKESIKHASKRWELQPRNDRIDKVRVTAPMISSGQSTKKAGSTTRIKVNSWHVVILANRCCVL